MTPRGSNCQATAPAAGQLAAGLGEDRADVGRGPVAIVGRGLDQDRHAARAVALVDDLLVLVGVAAAGRLLDRALDVFGRHVDRARLVHGQAEPVVGIRVAAALARAATQISRATLVKTAPRLASLAPFWRLIVDHFECPDIAGEYSRL